MKGFKKWGGGAIRRRFKGRAHLVKAQLETLTLNMHNLKTPTLNTLEVLKVGNGERAGR